MGVWSTTTPAGSDPIAEGDDRIRELKAALQEALGHESTFPGASPLTAPIFIPGFLYNTTANRPTGNDLVTGRIFFNTTTNVIERYNGATWDTIFTLPANASITEIQLSASVAGAGLAGGAGTVLSVNVDDSTIEINADTLRIKDLGVATAKIAAQAVDENKLNVSVAGNGLAGGGGAALSVNVDNSTIEINADTLRVKDAGITQAKLAAAVVAQLGVDIGLIARITATTTSTSFSDLVNISAHGRLDGYSFSTDAAAGAISRELIIILDGINHGTISLGAANLTGRVLLNNGNSTTMFISDTTSVGKMNDLLLFFRTSMQIQHRGGSSGTPGLTSYLQYERSA